MIVLKNRAHLFTHPKNKEALIGFFTALLGCTEIAAPTSLAFQFVDGSAVGVDFTEEVVDALDEQQARRGAWLELETDEPATLKEKILAAGYRHFEYKVKGFFYFQIPGGQVMRFKLP
jgi:hypothetical protein